MAVYISFRDHPESQDASQVTCLMRAQAFHGDFDGILAYVRNRLSWQIEFTSENCLCTEQKRVRAIDSHVKVFVYVRLCTLACKSSPKHVYIELCHWVSVLKFNLKFDTLYVGWWLALLDDGTNCLLHTHTLHKPIVWCRNAKFGEQYICVVAVRPSNFARQSYDEAAASAWQVRFSLYEMEIIRASCLSEHAYE